MNNRPSLLNLTLLGLIQLRPRTGYALMKVFQNTPIGRFSGSPGAIYPALQSLEESDLICGEIQNRDSLRPSKIFSLTPGGMKILHEWLSSPVSTYRNPTEDSIDVLRFSLMEGVLQKTEIASFLESLSEACDKYADSLGVQLENPEMTLHGKLALEGGIDAIRARAQWARTALQRIQLTEQ